MNSEISVLPFSPATSEFARMRGLGGEEQYAHPCSLFCLLTPFQITEAALLPLTPSPSPHKFGVSSNKWRSLSSEFAGRREQILFEVSAIGLAPCGSLNQQAVNGLSINRNGGILPPNHGPLFDDMVAGCAGCPQYLSAYNLITSPLTASATENPTRQHTRLGSTVFGRDQDTADRMARTRSRWTSW